MKFQHHHHVVDANRHDGTNESADDLAEWIREHGGKVEVFHKGSFEWDLKHAYLRLSNRFDRIVRPNFYVVKTEDNQFYSVYPDIFKRLYTLIDIKEDLRDAAQA